SLLRGAPSLFQGVATRHERPRHTQPESRRQPWLHCNGPDRRRNAPAFDVKQRAADRHARRVEKNPRSGLNRRVVYNIAPVARQDHCGSERGLTLSALATVRGTDPASLPAYAAEFLCVGFAFSAPAAVKPGSKFVNPLP